MARVRPPGWRIGNSRGNDRRRQLLTFECRGRAAAAACGDGRANPCRPRRVVERPRNKAQFHPRGSLALPDCDHRLQFSQNRWMGRGHALPQRTKAIHGAGCSEIDAESSSRRGYFGRRTRFGTDRSCNVRRGILHVGFDREGCGGLGEISRGRSIRGGSCRLGRCRSDLSDWICLFN